VLALGFASIVGELSSTGLDGWLGEAGVSAEARRGLVLRMADFRPLHRAVVEALDAAADGRAVPRDALDRLNETAALVPFAPRLRVEADRVVLVDEPDPSGRAADVLAAIARSAIRTLGSVDAERVRRCPSCLTFFLASRADRVWCGPACGNRARVARHHARRRRDAR
jgi:predicted RNA-binding Zn ribbon-like protein